LLDTLAAGSVARVSDGAVGVAGSDRPQPPIAREDARAIAVTVRKGGRMVWNGEG